MVQASEAMWVVKNGDLEQAKLTTVCEVFAELCQPTPALVL